MKTYDYVMAIIISFGINVMLYVAHSTNEINLIFKI